MRIARFARAGDDPAFGVVELPGDGGDHPDTVTVLNADPLAGPVHYTGERHRLADVRLLSPVIPRSKVVGIAGNYPGAGTPADGDPQDPAPGVAPASYLEPNTAVIGPEDIVVPPPGAGTVAYGGNLAVVIGRICKEVPVERAADVIFGYTIANDATLIDLLGTDGQWARARGFDTSCPIGPWIASHLELAEAAGLAITTTVDGEVRQSASTADMTHSIAELVAHVTSYTTLLPGDVILTGTPAGAGPWQGGTDVTVTIEGIGDLTNTLVPTLPTDTTTPTFQSGDDHQ